MLFGTLAVLHKLSLLRLVLNKALLRDHSISQTSRYNGSKLTPAKPLIYCIHDLLNNFKLYCVDSTSLIYPINRHNYSNLLKQLLTE